MSEVLKIRVIDTDSGRELYTEKIVDVTQKYEFAEPNGCVQFNGQADDYALIVAKEDGSYEGTLIEMVDTGFVESGATDAECVTLPADSLVVGSALYILNPARTLEGFMGSQSTSPIVANEIVGVAFAVAGGTKQSLKYYIEGDIRDAKLFYLFQIASEQLLAFVPLVSTAGTNLWRIAATVWRNLFRKTRDANVRVNVKQADGASHKVKVYVLREV